MVEVEQQRIRGDHSGGIASLGVLDLVEHGGESIDRYYTDGVEWNGIAEVAQFEWEPIDRHCTRVGAEHFIVSWVSTVL